MADKKYRVGFIGVGRPRSEEGATGYAMAYSHADGYLKSGRCDLVACADIVDANARGFARRYDIPVVCADYEKMLADQELDIVSICTWPKLHAEMVSAAAAAGIRAIHCEKPMAPTWRESREMVRICDERGSYLTFNHQRRYLEPFQIARKLAHDGTIGTLTRIEANCNDLYDWGTHWFDMFFFLNNETPAEWVIGQVDQRQDRVIFGVPVETQGICQFAFVNGVQALLLTGQANNAPAAHRLIGTDGMIEICWGKPHVRVLNSKNTGWLSMDTEDDLHSNVAFDRAMADVVAALDARKPCMLSAANAARATEVIFAGYESSRRRARVDLPLTIDDNPFAAMLEAGEFGVPVGGA